MGEQFLDEIAAILDESKEIHGDSVHRRIS